MKTLLGLALAASMVATPAGATSGMLYKAVSPNGTVIFSDTPPSGDVTLVEERALSAPSGGMPIRSTPNSAGGDPTQILDGDEAVARANEAVDMAEHALALARRGTWSPADGLKLQQTRLAPADIQRVEYYKTNLKTARTYLAELVRERQSRAAPIIVSMR